MMRLNGKICLVTGAGSGIGRATCELFASEGAVVIAVDINEDGARATAESVRDGGGTVTALACDVSSSADVARTVAAAVGAHGGLDVLINNAGYGMVGSVLDTSEEEWSRLIDVDLTSVYLVSRAVLPTLIERGGGTIVNVSSAGATVGLAQRAAYCAAKGGVAALTRAMAIDHAPQNIRVNAICPGTVDSPYYAAILEHSPDPSATLTALRARQVLRRLGTPEEIAAGILFLAGSDGTFCTGALLAVDGGMTAW
jgi:meso-butanediol dehydrogenase / (S,S)-butanediol dehydrogenase / diacetyl reductase